MANAIKYWREKRKMSQKDLAKQLNIDRPTLSKIENPNIPIDPNEDMALAIARVVDVMVTDILRKRNEN